MADPVPYIPRLLGGGHFVLLGRPLKLPPHVAGSLNHKVKENFIRCLIRGTPEQLSYFFKAGGEYVQMQKGIQEAIRNAPHEALLRKVYIAVEIGATIVFFAIGLYSLSKL